MVVTLSATEAGPEIEVAADVDAEVVAVEATIAPVILLSVLVIGKVG